MFLFRDQLSRRNGSALSLDGGKSELSKKNVVRRLRARTETGQ